LRFIGDFEDIGSYAGLYTFVASPRHSSLRNQSQIRFIVDTGNLHTTICARDAIISGIAYSNGLKQSLFQNPSSGGVLIVAEESLYYIT